MQSTNLWQQVFGSAADLYFGFCSLQEWRHAHGMRCLGIPNTAHFANVTQIEDAVSCKIPLPRARKDCCVELLPF